MLGGKILLDYTNLFSQMTTKTMTKYYISILRTNMSSLKFRLKNR